VQEVAFGFVLSDSTYHIEEGMGVVEWHNVGTIYRWVALFWRMKVINSYTIGSQSNWTDKEMAVRGQTAP